MIVRSIRGLAMVLASVALASLFLMMLQTVVDVLASNLAGRPIAGNLEIISVYHMVLVVFLPLAFVERNHENITVDLLYNALPRRMQRWVLVGGYLVTAAFLGILVWQTGSDAMRSFQLNEMIMGAVYVTIWPAKLALPIGFVAAFLMVLANAYQAATDPDFDPSPAVPEESAPE